MKPQFNTRRPNDSFFPRSLAFALAPVLLCVACTETDDDNQAFSTKTLGASTASNSPLAVGDRYMAFAGSELGTGSGGTDLNEDGDVNDDVVHVVALGNDAITRLKVALIPGADETNMLWVGETLYLVVDEAGDNRDWNTDGDMGDEVLVYWTEGMSAPQFIDEVEDDELFVAGGELVYVSESSTAATGETNLSRIPAASNPPTPTPIGTGFMDPGTDGLILRLRGAENGVVWMSASEADEGSDLNADSDTLDDAVFAFYEAGSGNGVQLVPLALPGGNPEVAVITSGGNQILAFMVDEASQGANLNDPALFPGLWAASQCSGIEDTDTLDEVLHWVDVNAFTADAVMNPPVNTGLVGDGDVYSLGDSWVAVVTSESDEGQGGGCDLNQDGDASDQVLRWVELTPTAVPENDMTKLVALDTSIAGGTGGVIELDNRLWVALVDEAADGRNYDGSATDNVFLGVLDPDLPGTGWNFDMGGSTFIGVSWMAQDAATDGRFLAAITEASANADRNNDGDITDSIPTFPFESGAPRELDFPGVSVAVEPNNPGIVTSGSFGYYRINETAQGFDYNLDGDLGDTILARVNLTGSEPATSMGVLQNTARPAVQVGRDGNARGIVWLAPESLDGPSGSDLNGDGDASDLAIRYARLP